MLKNPDAIILCFSYRTQRACAGAPASPYIDQLLHIQDACVSTHTAAIVEDPVFCSSTSTTSSSSSRSCAPAESHVNHGRRPAGDPPDLSRAAAEQTRGASQSRGRIRLRLRGGETPSGRVARLGRRKLPTYSFDFLITVLRFEIIIYPFIPVPGQVFSQVQCHLRGQKVRFYFDFFFYTPYRRLIKKSDFPFFQSGAARRSSAGRAACRVSDPPRGYRFSLTFYGHANNL